MVVWRQPGLHDVIKRACLIDQEGEAVPEYLLLLGMEDIEIHILGLTTRENLYVEAYQ